MPYNLPSEVGGDSEENTQWMERCVSKVMKEKDKSGNKIPKDRAIAMCKSVLVKSKSKAKAEFIISNIFDK